MEQLHLWKKNTPIITLQNQNCYENSIFSGNLLQSKLLFEPNSINFNADLANYIFFVEII